VKTWLAILLCLPLLVLADEEEQDGKEDNIEGWESAAPPREPPETDITWVDSSHAYATNKAQALAEWMDRYFGDPDYDIERAESLLRLEWDNEWDEEDRYNNKLRLRGKLQLPRISQRLNLVFSGEDGDDLAEPDRNRDDEIGLLFNVGEEGKSRVDLTMGFNWDGLRPGIRYRHQGPIGRKFRYRYTQRLQWETDEGFFTTGRVNLDWARSSSRLVRWGNRAVYGEETQDVEWRTSLSMSQRLRDPHKKHQAVLAFYGSINGATDPSLVKNYRLGAVLRRQLYRRYLFVELEPSYNLRKRDPDDQRKSMWSFILRFEVALERDLLRKPLLDSN
jgi:hypothetical protein